MNGIIPQLQPYKQVIPQFIMKLYHILQKRQHEEYLSWFGNDEVLIKHPRKFEEKVLPKYFRHKHLSSFVRQLNMYKFSKVAKIIKQKNHMYFKNQNFQRGQIEKLLNMKRNIKKNRISAQTIAHENENCVQNSEDVSINEKLHQNERGIKQLNDYKQHVKKSVTQIKKLISKFSSNPQLEIELRQAMYICENLLEQKKESNHSLDYLSSTLKSSENLILTSQRALPKIQGMVIFPSLCSISNFNSYNSN